MSKETKNPKDPRRVKGAQRAALTVAGNTPPRIRRRQIALTHDEDTALAAAAEKNGQSMPDFIMGMYEKLKKLYPENY